jgi:thioesterase domain-containing protein
MGGVTDDLFAAATEHLAAAIPLMERLGVRLVDLGPGRAAAEIPFEGNGNHVGTMYAGALFSVCEVLGGVICTATFDGARYAPIVKGAEIRYLRPATGPVRADASLDDATVKDVGAAADENGKADFVLDVTATGADGTVVATLRGDYQLRRREERR